MNLSVYGIGQEAEQMFARYLNQLGYLVVPISEYTNNTGLKINAPMLLGRDGFGISPDLLAGKDGKMRWVEVKQKTEPSYFWKKQQWEHGIDKPNADDYLSIQEESGFPVVIVVREIKSPRTPDLRLSSMRDISSYRKMKDDLYLSDCWLRISLNNAIAKGQYREGNKEMMDDRNPEGWGLYWPRAAMKLIPLPS